MGEDRDTDGLPITEEAKQAGAEAFSRTIGQSTYDALKDEGLSAEMMALWDYETVEMLQGAINANDQAAGFVLKAARASYLAAVCAALGIRQSRRKGR